jgi:arylsulfatase A-like enzyme
MSESRYLGPAPGGRGPSARSARPGSPDLGLPAGTRPDILLIVMDCVRGSDFSVGSPTLAGMPFCSRLATESARFQRAVAPASWTIPSHASLFTGLYPWEHRLHARGETRLSPALPTLASELGRAGYRTASFSANPFIGDVTGLADGFDSAAWGGWWERYARHLGGTTPPGGRPPPAQPRNRRPPLPASNLRPLLRSVSRSSLRRPLAFQVGNRLLHLVHHREGECPTCVAPWIEPSLRQWMLAQPADAPRFVFVNLMEAHEPYVVADGAEPTRELIRSLTVRQDFGEWLEGEWAPTSSERATLRRLYSRAIRALDHRIEAIVGIFRETRRWDSTVAILTSDHGQGFGEEGMLSHGMSVADSVARIPLWLRTPGASLSGQVSTSWASLTDVAPTCLRLAGAAPSRLPDGPGLLPLLEGGRSDPVWSMSEGVIWKDARARLAPEQFERFDRLLLAGFFRNSKVVYDATHRRISLQPLYGPGAAGDPPPVSEAEMVQGMIAFMDRVGSSFGTPPSSAPPLDKVEAWGYA